MSFYGCGCNLGCILWYLSWQLCNVTLSAGRVIREVQPHRRGLHEHWYWNAEYSIFLAVHYTVLHIIQYGIPVLHPTTLHMFVDLSSQRRSVQLRAHGAVLSLLVINHLIHRGCDPPRRTTSTRCIGYYKERNTLSEHKDRPRIPDSLEITFPPPDETHSQEVRLMGGDLRI